MLLQVEIQSEYWVSIQVTLYIVVIHYRIMAEDGTFKAVSEAHVCVSSDPHHDTHFVQHFMERLADHLKSRGLEFDIWNINTDGAASHFKNRSTFFSLFAFKNKTGASEVMWETCAPGQSNLIVESRSRCHHRVILCCVSFSFVLLSRVLNVVDLLSLQVTGKDPGTGSVQ